jgi:hypothetical protein
VRSGTTRAYQFDGMRSTRQMLDTSGSVTDTFGFDLLGNVRSRTGSTPTPFTWNVGAGKAGSSDGLYFQFRWRPFTQSPWGFGTLWDPFGGNDLGGLLGSDWLEGKMRRGRRSYEMLMQLASGKLQLSEIVVVHREGGRIVPQGKPGPGSGGPLIQMGKPGHPPTPAPTIPFEKPQTCENKPPCHEGSTGSAYEVCIAALCSANSAYELYEKMKGILELLDIEEIDKLIKGALDKLKEWGNDPFTSTEECCKKAKANPAFDYQDRIWWISLVCSYYRGNNRSTVCAAAYGCDPTDPDSTGSMSGCKACCNSVDTGPGRQNCLDMCELAC